MSPAVIRQLVESEQNKESVLQKNYGITITEAMTQAEVERIDSTTRSPETLQEIKTALDNDPHRFAETVAKPIVVERLLREKFENDDSLHLAQRQDAEKTREQLLTAKGKGASVSDLVALLKQTHSNTVSQITWQMGARPAATNNTPNSDLAEIQKRFGANAKILSSPSDAGRDSKFYFTDLPPALQRVLRLQLRQAGDISAVIEMPNGFILHIAEEKTADILKTTALSLPKRSYEEWLKEISTLKKAP